MRANLDVALPIWSFGKRVRSLPQPARDLNTAMRAIAGRNEVEPWDACQRQTAALWRNAGHPETIRDDDGELSARRGAQIVRNSGEPAVLPAVASNGGRRRGLGHVPPPPRRQSD